MNESKLKEQLRRMLGSLTAGSVLHLLAELFREEAEAARRNGDDLAADECERVDAPALGQTLALIGSPEIQEKLTADKGYVKRLAGNAKPHDENVRDIFRRVFGRAPRPKELVAAVKYLESERDRKEAYGSLLWSLLATNEFLFNH